MRRLTETWRESRWNLLWWIAIVGSVPLVGELVLERTLLTWIRGPQMVGFALAHSGIAVPVLLGALLGHIWLFVYPMAWAVQAARGRPLPRVTWRKWIVLAESLGSLYVPDYAWRVALIVISGGGLHREELLVDGAGQGQLVVVRKLLEKGVAIDARNEDGYTALNGAAVAGTFEIARFLLDRGANPNVKESVLGRTPLMGAAEMGRPAIVKELLGRGAQGDLRDLRGESALTIAARNGHSDIVDILRRAGYKE